MEQKIYSFKVQKLDQNTQSPRLLHFLFYLPENLVQMYELKTHKIILKKTNYPYLFADDLYIGATFTCFEKQYKIIDYIDETFKKQQQLAKTYAMIKPNAYDNIGKIITIVQQNFQIGHLRMFKFTIPQAKLFYAQHINKPFFNKLIEFMTSGYSVGMQLVDKNAITKWRKILGPTNSVVARQQAPNSIRALYGVDSARNACHGSDSEKSAQRQLDLIFSQQSNLKPYPILNHCTLCIIKPHILQSKCVGQILDMILTSGFEINAIQMCKLNISNAKDFFDMDQYLSQYDQIIEDMISGPIIALQVNPKNSVFPFEDLCGPNDPEIARMYLPNSIRAIFGENTVKNAIHCIYQIGSKNKKM